MKWIKSRYSRQLLILTAAILLIALISGISTYAQSPSPSPTASTPPTPSASVSPTTSPTPLIPPALSVAIGTPPPEITQNAASWPSANHDYSNTRYTKDSAINSNNVNNLQVAWTYPIAQEGGAGNSIILNNTVYFEDLESNIAALDLNTGAVKWQKQYNLPVLGPNGVAAGYGIIFATKGYYNLVALDINSGQELWSTSLSSKDTVAVLIQPVVFDNKVYVSTAAGGTGKPNPGGGRGVLYALDQATGKIVWSFDTTPADLWGNPAVNYGGGSYQSPAIDIRSGETFWGIANAAPGPGTDAYPNGSSRPGPNLYTNSLLDISRNGQLQWFNQVYPHDLFNFGLSIPPILTSANIADKFQDIVIGSGKTGRVYAFNRDTGAILWETVVGTHSNDQLASLPSGATTRVYPAGEGGVETPLAYANGIVYVSVIDMYSDFTTSNSTDQDITTATGELVAIQVETGKILWDVPLDSVNIGAATVVNDLVFTGTLSGKIYAFKPDTGQQVWTYQASPGVTGWPALSGNMVVFMAGTKNGGALTAFKLGTSPPPSSTPASTVSPAASPSPSPSPSPTPSPVISPSSSPKASP
jgi:outer membrane protein assembly factor BamB